MSSTKMGSSARCAVVLWLGCGLHWILDNFGAVVTAIFLLIVVVDHAYANDVSHAVQLNIGCIGFPEESKCAKIFNARPAG